MSKPKHHDIITEEDFNRMAAGRGIPEPQEDNSSETQAMEVELGEHFVDGPLEGDEADDEMDSPLVAHDRDQEKVDDGVINRPSSGGSRSSTWPDAADIIEGA
jgi:hypothetical protein